ncbi:Protein archease [Trichinella nelsoni]|uniref:Protein archease-like n=1 Tax=Trichinella nelsoni TaxID=6336 RepID=A0A0V0S284_9BILA|nr:Protein archease [Trichinella nelsoni]
MNPFCRSVPSSSCSGGSLSAVSGMAYCYLTHQFQMSDLISRRYDHDLFILVKLVDSKMKLLNDYASGPLREIFRDNAIDCNFDVRLETYSCKMVSEDKRRFREFLKSIGPNAAPHDSQVLAPYEELSPDFRNNRRTMPVERTESGGEIVRKCYRYTIENKRLFYLLEALSFCFEDYDFMNTKSTRFCLMESFQDVQNSVNWKVLPFFRHYRYISRFIWNKIKEVIDTDRCVFYGYIPEEGDPICENSCLSSSTFLMYNPYLKRILVYCVRLLIPPMTYGTLIPMLSGGSEELPIEEDALVRSSTDCPFNATIKYEHLDHTADIMLHAWGDNLIEAFEQVTMAMFAYLTDLNKVDACFSYDVEVRGSDEKTMLFDFLNEWFAAFNGEPFFIPRYIKIISFNLTDGYMTARAWGESFDVSKHIQRMEVKAVTLNNMKIVKKDNGYEIFVVLDI